MRSAVVMLVAGAILLAIGGYLVFHHYWPVLAHEKLPVKVGIIMLVGYGALLMAVMIRRIIEPGLDMPLLAWIVAFAYFIFAHTHRSTEERLRDEERERRGEAKESSSFGKQGTGMGWAIGLTLVGALLFAAGIGIAYIVVGSRLKDIEFANKTAATKVAPKPAPAKPEPTPAPTEQIRPAPAAKDILDQGDLLHALGYAAMRMSDDTEPSEGSKQFARWLDKKGTYSELDVRNQTTIELAEKDIKKARGNKLCVAGTLERIEKEAGAGFELYGARLVMANKDLLEVYAVGKTGALVKRKPAKFCGVITGALREGRATVPFAVGMFDTNK